jgi:hypothetical protein
LKEYLESKGSFKSGIFCVDSSTRKDFDFDNLRKRNVIVVDWCCVCKSSERSIDHFLFHSEVARNLWPSIFHLFGVDLVMPRRVIELLAS